MFRKSLYSMDVVTCRDWQQEYILSRLVVRIDGSLFTGDIVLIAEWCVSEGNNVNKWKCE